MGVCKPAFEDTWTPISADGIVADGPVEVSAIILTAGDGADASLVLYNAESATGDSITIKAVQKTSFPMTFPKPIPFTVGIYADITGAGATAMVARTNS